MRWRERGAWWRTLLGLIVAIVVLLVVHVSLLVAGPPPAVRDAWIALTVAMLVVGLGAWFLAAILPAALRSMEVRGAELELPAKTPGWFCPCGAVCGSRGIALRGSRWMERG